MCLIHLRSGVFQPQIDHDMLPHLCKLLHPFVRIVRIAWIELLFIEINVVQVVQIMQIELLFGETHIVRIMQVAQIVQTELPFWELCCGRV